MDVMTGVVVEGKVVVEGESLPEGRTVGVIIDDVDDTFELPAEDVDELADRIRSAERGNFADGRELLNRLRGGGQQ